MDAYDKYRDNVQVLNTTGFCHNKTYFLPFAGQVMGCVSK